MNKKIISTFLLLLLITVFIFSGCHKKDSADSVIDDINKTQYSIQPSKDNIEIQNVESITTTTTTQPVTTTTTSATTTVTTTTIPNKDYGNNKFFDILPKYKVGETCILNRNNINLYSLTINSIEEIDSSNPNYINTVPHNYLVNYTFVNLIGHPFYIGGMIFNIADSKTLLRCGCVSRKLDNMNYYTKLNETYKGKLLLVTNNTELGINLYFEVVNSENSYGSTICFYLDV